MKFPELFRDLNASVYLPLPHRLSLLSASPPWMSAPPIRRKGWQAKECHRMFMIYLFACRYPHSILFFTHMSVLLPSFRPEIEDVRGSRSPTKQTNCISFCETKRRCLFVSTRSSHLQTRSLHLFPCTDLCSWSAQGSGLTQLTAGVDGKA